MICDFAEFYQVYDYKSLPLRTAAAFFMGLRHDSRSKMSLSGQKYTLAEMMSVMIYDKLAWLQWSKTESGANGTNMPQPLAKKLFTDGTDVSENETEGFSSAEEFEAERNKLLRIGRSD